MRLGIDATNIGGGGGITHLKEILLNFNSELYAEKISKLVVFGSHKVLDSLPERPYIEKVTFQSLNKGLLSRVIFQLKDYDREIAARCDMLMSLTGDYTGKFSPVVGMCRNMLLYEKDIWRETKQYKEILKFWLSKKRQQKSFKKSNGVIFISNYAKTYVLKQLDLKGVDTKIIHHGISTRFKANVKKQLHIKEYSDQNRFKFLYVSTVHSYKHQWQIVNAIGKLRDKGYHVELTLIGGIIFKPAGDKLKEAIKNVDPDNEFIYYKGHIAYEEIERYYKDADGIVFASTCENMPNILIESMASGVPIACSLKEPMPEFLKDGGFYFDAYRLDSIIETLEKMLLNPDDRALFAEQNLREVVNYSWVKTSQQTFDYLCSFYYKN